LLSEGVVEGPSPKRYFEDDSSILVHEPFTLKEWVDRNKTELETNGLASMFNTSQTRVIVYHKGTYARDEKHETFFWQTSGVSTLKSGGQEWKLEKDDMFLLPPSSFEILLDPVDSYLITVQQSSQFHK